MVNLLESIAREFPLLGDITAHLLNLEYPSIRVQCDSSEPWLLRELDHIIEAGDEAEAIQAKIDKLNFQKGELMAMGGEDSDNALGKIEWQMRDLKVRLNEIENPEQGDWKSFHSEDRLSGTCWDVPQWTAEQEEPGVWKQWCRTAEDWEQCLDNCQENLSRVQAWGADDPSKEAGVARIQKEIAYVQDKLAEFETPGEEPNED
jgi:hypothetical protein